MKLLLILPLILSIAACTNALMCWVCHNARSNSDCRRNGRLLRCQNNEGACQNVVRRGSFGMLIYKRCKQAHACDNNFIQNPQPSWQSTQCNTRQPGSVCRCCCNTDACNAEQLECLSGGQRLRLNTEQTACAPLPSRLHVKMDCFLNRRKLRPEGDYDLGSECRFSCDEGFTMIGRKTSRCLYNNRLQKASFNAPAPRCRASTCFPSITAPRNGEMYCSDGQKLASKCTFTCDKGLVLVGSTTRTCLPSRKWSGKSSRCEKPVCSPPHRDPRNGLLVQCDDTNNRFSACRFQCNDGFFMNGSPISRCVDDPNSRTGLSWSTPTPRCTRILCESQTEPANGRMVCTNGRRVGSTCTFSCNEGFNLDGSNQADCTDNFENDVVGEWTFPPPICVEERACLILDTPTNGRMQCSDSHKISSVCTMKCDEGFYLLGSPSIRCEEDPITTTGASWSENTPQCQAVHCSEQEAPLHGEVTCNNETNIGSVCSFTCDATYRLVGDKTIACYDDKDGDSLGRWDLPEPTCQALICEIPSPPTNSAISCTDSDKIGSVCEFQCNEGFFLQGSSTIECVQDSTDIDQSSWSNNVPRCVEILCTNLNAPNNGQISCSNNFKLSSTCTFQCDAGFSLVGSINARCEENTLDDGVASWTIDVPQCEPIRCPAQLAPANGDVTCIGNVDLNGVCRFSCDFGYELVGNVENQCTDDFNGDIFGQWSGPSPTCEEVLCTNLNAPNNGQISCSNNFKLSSTCTFQCDAGFSLVGSINARCEENTLDDGVASWNIDVPQCEPIRCPAQLTPANGNVSCVGNVDLGGVCRFDCDFGYELVGNVENQCNGDFDGDLFGQWSGPPPTCRELFCHLLTSLIEGTISCSDNNKIGSICQFQCNEGFSLEGISTTQCLQDSSDADRSSWSDDAPLCRPIRCPAQLAPANGNVSCAGNVDLGSVCKFTCDFGYELVGNEENQCNDDFNGDVVGQWSGPPPTCQEILCTNLNAPNNGQISCSNNFKLSSTCTFQCDAGFSLIGSINARCDQNNLEDDVALWTNDVPQCEPIQCPAQLAPPNGNVSCIGNVDLNGVCRFSCDFGYKLVGDVENQCNDDFNGDIVGQWSGSIPTCEEIFCTNLNAPNNGQISCSNNFKLSSTCTFQCDAGFSLVGSISTGCDQNNLDLGVASWNDDVPQCEPIQCPAQLAPTNGNVSCNGNVELGGVCRFSCDFGYELIGNEENQCNDDFNGDVLGQWSGPIPTCKEILCTNLNAPNNGQISCSNNFKLSSTCTFQCDAGFSLVGSINARCEENTLDDGVASWTIDVPQCEPIRCPSQLVPANGNSSCIGNVDLNGVCRFSCDFGYELVGNVENQCNDDFDGDIFGQWSGPPPTCRELFCHLLTSLIEGTISCSDNNKIGSICQFQCNEGFSLEGISTTQCLQDSSDADRSSWSDDAPLCRPIRCPAQLAPANGNASCAGNVDLGSVCKFTCDFGYELVGNEENQCNDDFNGDVVGQWSGLPPTCREIICTNLNAPNNGQISCSNDFKLSSTCTFQCDAGFSLIGSVSTRCDQNNLDDDAAIWTNDVPKCEPIQCPAQLAPANGNVSCIGIVDLNGVCRFSCDFGYKLVGNVENQCNDDFNGDIVGQWSGSIPLCEEIICTNLNAPNNGQISCSNNFKLSSSCSFQCDAGFSLVGSISTRCDQNNLEDDVASWTNDVPQCELIQCPSQLAPANGNVSCVGNVDYDGVCRFSCDFGYELVGNEENQCTDGLDGDTVGRWSGQPPTCEEIYCTVLSSPSSGEITCSDNNRVLSVCISECNIGFSLVGIASTICEEDVLSDTGASWSSNAPQCAPIQCLAQIAPTNGDVSCSGNVDLSGVCRFSCDFGYELIGNEENQCNDDFNGDTVGRWSGPPPTCREILCTNLNAPNNGQISCSNNFKLSSTCTFQCDAGFSLVGSINARCDQNDESDASWTNVVPQCAPIRCPAQSAPANGNVSCNGNIELDGVCRFSCDYEYELVGNEENQCNDDFDGDTVGQWSGPPPTCREFRCDFLPQPGNGGHNCSDSNKLGSSCDFSCDKDYLIFPPNETQATCNRDGWSKPIPCCSLSCPPHALMDLVLVLDSSSSIGAPNWRIMKRFIREFISSFRFTNQFSRLSVFRYNKFVDNTSQILFNSHINNEKALIEAFDRIPYGGSGTRTGQALQHINDVILKEVNGNRPGVIDIVIVITDGRAQDGALLVREATKLRESGALTYAVGIQPGRGRRRLDNSQLQAIGGLPEHVLVVEGGFEGLGGLLQTRISDQVCLNRCLI